MPDTPRSVLLVEAWLLTYLIHSTVLLGSTALLSRALAVRFERVSEAAWRVAMFGAVATTFAQLAWFTSPATLLVLGAGTQPTGAAPPTRPLPGAESVQGAVPRLLTALLLLWLTLAVARLIVLARAHRALARLSADRVPLSDVHVAARVRALCGTIVARVTVSRRAITPMVIGHRELCLPERALHDLSSDELDAVLAHEIAHIARHDRLWLLLASIMERALFLQPLNALAASRLRAVAECSCDDWALRRTGSPLALASALARVTEWLAGAPSERLAVGMASRESLALARVRRILDPTALRYAGEHRPLQMLALTLVLPGMIMLAPGVSAGPVGLHPLSLETPAMRYTIHAKDDGGVFTLTLDGGRAVAMTIDGASVDPRRLRQDGNRLQVTDAHGGVMFEITLAPAGGIQWTSRPKPLIASR